MSDNNQSIVLVVDGDEAGRVAMARGLRAAGFMVWEAANGAEALEKAAQGPDIVVLSEHLPDIRGSEVCRQIKSNPAIARLPVIHLSATCVQRAEHVTGLQMRADSYLVQPVDMAELVAVISALLLAKKRETQLQESEERFRHVYENSLVGIYRSTPEGRVLMANPAFVAMLGYKSFEEVAKVNFDEEGFHPEYDRRRFKEEMERNGRVIGLEGMWKRDDGTTLNLLESAQAVRDEKGRILYYDGVVEDITERKRAERALEERERQLNTLMNNLPGMAYRCANDPEWTMQIVSAGVRELTGYEAEELLGNACISYAGLIHPEDRNMVWESVQAAVSANRPFVLEYRIRTKSGEEKWV